MKAGRARRTGLPDGSTKGRKSYVLREDRIAVCKTAMLVLFTYVNCTSCGDGF